VTTKTWAGSPTNDASDPSAWTPSGAPAVGDTLQMPSGTMNVSGADLAGNVLHAQGDREGNIGGTHVFNLSGQNAQLELLAGNYGENTTVNIADGTDWVGGISTGGPGSVTTIAGSGGHWTNAASGFNGSAKINADIDGTGTISIGEAHGAGVVEFGGAVGSGQSVTVNGYETYGGEFGDVQVDNPATYQASTTLGFGEIHLEGLQADSYAQSPTQLTLYDGGKPVDTLNLTVTKVGDAAPKDFGVSQAAGDDEHADRQGDIGDEQQRLGLLTGAQAEPRRSPAPA